MQTKVLDVMLLLPVIMPGDYFSSGRKHEIADSPSAVLTDFTSRECYYSLPYRISSNSINKCGQGKKAIGSTKLNKYRPHLKIYFFCS